METCQTMLNNYSTGSTIDRPITLESVTDNAATKVKEILLFFDRYLDIKF
jgi:hypothetical protein